MFPFIPISLYSHTAVEVDLEPSQISKMELFQKMLLSKIPETINPSHPDRGRREKSYLNVNLHISLSCLKRFYEGLKRFYEGFRGLHKTF